MSETTVMEWKKKSLRELARMICGDEEASLYFPYRSSSYLTEFFEDCDLEYVHDGSTRWRWVSDRLEEVLALPQQSPQIPPDPLIRIIRTLLDLREAQPGDDDRANALSALNTVLQREGWEAFYDDGSIAQLRHIKTNTTTQIVNPPSPIVLGGDRSREAALRLFGSVFRR